MRFFLDSFVGVLLAMLGILFAILIWLGSSHLLSGVHVEFEELARSPVLFYAHYFKSAVIIAMGAAGIIVFLAFLTKGLHKYELNYKSVFLVLLLFFFTIGTISSTIHLWELFQIPVSERNG